MRRVWYQEVPDGRCQEVAVAWHSHCGGLLQIADVWPPVTAISSCLSGEQPKVNAVTRLGCIVKIAFAIRVMAFEASEFQHCV